MARYIRGQIRGSSTRMILQACWAGRCLMPMGSDRTPPDLPESPAGLLLEAIYVCQMTEHSKQPLTGLPVCTL